MTLAKKTKILENYLSESPTNFRDTFKTDIYLFFNEDFTTENPLLNFLDVFESKEDILSWVDKVTSQIVLKFDENEEELGDFIWDHIAVEN